MPSHFTEYQRSMNRTQTLQHQSAFRDFARIDHWHAPHAVTLTMKQGRQVDSGRSSMHLVLTPHEAEVNMRHFINRLSKKVFGNAASRYGKAVPIIPALEGGNGKRLHYHAVIDCPRDDLLGQFPAMIQDTWLETPWSLRETDIQTYADAGWVNYISKLRDKTNYADSIDWSNVHTLDR